MYYSGEPRPGLRYRQQVPPRPSPPGWAGPSLLMASLHQMVAIVGTGTQKRPCGQRPHNAWHWASLSLHLLGWALPWVQQLRAWGQCSEQTDAPPSCAHRAPGAPHLRAVGPRGSSPRPAGIPKPAQTGCGAWGREGHPPRVQRPGWVGPVLAASSPWLVISMPPDCVSGLWVPTEASGGG